MKIDILLNKKKPIIYIICRGVFFIRMLITIWLMGHNVPICLQDKPTQSIPKFLTTSGKLYYI